MALHEGEIVGQYQIAGQLGQGGMATVYKAYHPKLDRYVAIKVLHHAYKEDADFLARFQREAQIVARLEHPHIIPVYDFNEYENQPYLVMKFIEGRTLKRRLQESTVKLDEIISIMGSVASALTYAHENGVLHRDIKPSNIMLDKNGIPYLTDFGLARIAQAGTSTMSADMILGTPQYISPEQASGQGTLDARTDIYSLGVILYEMVVGRVPFNADTPYAIVHQHIYNELPRPTSIDSTIPQQVEDVLVKALAKNPADRYSSAVEMTQAFREAVQSVKLAALNPDRDKLAQEALANNTYEGPTISKNLPPPPSIPSPLPSDRTPPQIPVIPPVPPVPSASTPVPNRRSEVEFQLNMDSLGNVGKRMEEGFRRSTAWVERMAANIEEAAKEGAREAGRNKVVIPPQPPNSWRRPPPPVITPEERIRQRIEKRHKERQGFFVHFLIYLIINIMLWSLWAGSIQMILPTLQDQLPEVAQQGMQLPWPMFVTLGWGIGILAHFLGYYNKYGGGAERREREIERETQRYMERTTSYEKPKNDAYKRLELTDDGEIVEVEDEASRAEKRKRRQR